MLRGNKLIKSELKGVH